MNDSICVSAWEAARGEAICVVGVGARSSVGADAIATAAAVRGGISGLALHPVFKDRSGEPVSFASDPTMAHGHPLDQRMLAMMRAVAEEALAQSSNDTARIVPDCCVLALPEPRAGMPSDIADLLADAQAQHLGLPRESVRTFARGHAAGLMAIQAASQWLDQGEFRAVLVIGVDSYHDATSLRSLELHRRLKCGDVRGGFPPGEGAGACMLVRSDAAERGGFPVFARVFAASTAVEPHPLRATEPCIGEGLTAAIASATKGLRLPQEQITLTYCDLNGERFRNEEFMFAQLRTQDAFADANRYLSPADCWGDVGAASGPLYLALAAHSRLRGYAKGAYPLLWAGSDAGYRSAVALTLAEARGPT